MFIFKLLLLFWLVLWVTGPNHSKFSLQIFSFLLLHKLRIVSLPLLNQLLSCSFNLFPIFLLILFHNSKLNCLFNLFYHFKCVFGTIARRLNNSNLFTNFIDVHLSLWRFSPFDSLFSVQFLNVFLHFWLQMAQSQSSKFLIELLLVLFYVK